MARAHPQSAQLRLSTSRCRGSRSRLPRSAREGVRRAEAGNTKGLVAAQVHQPEDSFRGCIRSAARLEEPYCSSSVGTHSGWRRRTPSDRGRSRRRCRATRLSVSEKLVHDSQRGSVVAVERDGGEIDQVAQLLLRGARSAARRSYSALIGRLRVEHDPATPSTMSRSPVLILDAEAPRRRRRSERAARIELWENLLPPRSERPHLSSSRRAVIEAGALRRPRVAPSGICRTGELLPATREQPLSTSWMPPPRAQMAVPRTSGSWCTRQTSDTAASTLIRCSAAERSTLLAQEQGSPRASLCRRRCPPGSDRCLAHSSCKASMFCVRPGDRRSKRAPLAVQLDARDPSLRNV